MTKRSKQAYQQRFPHDKQSRLPIHSTNDGPPAWLVSVVLIVAIAALYGPALNAPFIFDDVISIVNNESIRSLWPWSGSDERPGPLKPAKDLPTAGRPLVNLSFAINYRLGGLNPVGYHALNVLIHIGSALLVWAIIQRSLRLPYFGDRFNTSARWLALAVALLWALHPLQTEAVIYATQRTELMMAFFYLATLYCSLRYWQLAPASAAFVEIRPKKTSDGRHWRGALWVVLATLACLAGMASKEVMVSAPLIMLLFERTFVSGSLMKSLRCSWPLYLGLASTWLLLLMLNIDNPRGGSAGFGMGVSATSWWLTQSKVLLMYLKLVVWPAPLLLHYELPYLTTLAEAWMYSLPVVLLGLITLVLLWRNHPIGFLGTWLFAILSPTLLVPIVTEMAAERRMYLPLVALVVLFVVGSYQLVNTFVSRWKNTPRIILGMEFPLFATLVLSLFLTGGGVWLSYKRLDSYHDELGLWQEVLRHQPQNYVAHLSMGNIFDDKGNIQQAIEHYREAVRLKPDSRQANQGLGVLLTKTGEYNEAADCFANALRIDPADLRTRINLAGVLTIAGRYDEAIEVSRETLKLEPDDWIVHNNLAEALKRAGRYEEAVESFQKALQLNPDALALYHDIADTYSLAGQTGEAITALKQGLERAQSLGDDENERKFTERLKAISP